jgi:uncharacterized protein (TIGR02453 family)
MTRDTGTFEGFSPRTFAFLRDLDRHMTREWFEAHRDAYERDVRTPMVGLLAATISAFSAQRLPLTGEPKSAMFRIHRDVRFAKDKRPYKTHAGAVLTRSGSKSDPGLFYVHIDPKGSFTACGFYVPEAAVLDTLRRAIRAKPKLWLSMLKSLDTAGLALDPDETALKRLPKGFEDCAGTPVEDAIKSRSFVVRRALTAKEVASADLPHTLSDFAKRARPLLDFGWAAIDGKDKR